jgi:hypothetical protein
MIFLKTHPIQSGLNVNSIFLLGIAVHGAPSDAKSRAAPLPEPDRRQLPAQTVRQCPLLGRALLRAPTPGFLVMSNLMRVERVSSAESSEHGPAS